MEKESARPCQPHHLKAWFSLGGFDKVAETRWHFLIVPLPIRIKKKKKSPLLLCTYVCSVARVPTAANQPLQDQIHPTSLLFLSFHAGCSAVPQTSQLCFHPRAFARAVLSHGMFPPGMHIAPLPGLFSNVTCLTY